MKKNLLIATAVCALLFTINFAQARNKHLQQYLKTHTNQNQNLLKSRRQIFAVLEKQQAALAAKNKSAERTTNYPSERLIATSEYSYSYADTPQQAYGISDSSKYVYSGQRGSVFNADEMNFIAPSGSFFSAANVFNYYFFGSLYSFTTNVNISNVLADTGYFWNSNNQNADFNYYFEYAEKVYNVYDSINQVTFCSDQLNPIDSSGQWDNYYNIYDAAGNITSALDLRWTGFSWGDTNSITIFKYNTAGQLIEDSTDNHAGIGVWAPTYTDYYYYDASGNVTSVIGWQYSAGMWAEYVKGYMAYNTDNTLHTDSVVADVSGVWTMEESDSFGYTPGVSYWTYNKEYQNQNPGYVDIILSKHVSASRLPDTIYENYYSTTFSTYTNGFLGGQKFGYVYDGYNNPTAAYLYEFNVTDTVAGTGSYLAADSGAIFFYYENYIAAAVNKVNAPAINVVLFPNPASNSINISITGIAQGTKTVIKLQNMLGQTMLGETLPWMNQTESLPLSGIATGTYIVLIQDGNGNTLSSQKIIKQ